MSPLHLVPGDDEAPKAEPEHRKGGPVDDEDGEEDGEEDESSRRRTNITLGLAVIAVVAIGIWLVNALLEQRRIDNCMAQGRRNCGQVEVPGR